MPFNIIAVLVAALVPMALGFIWYNPKTPMGATWMKETGMTEEKMQGSNMAVIFGLSLLFAFMLAFSLGGIVVHQAAAGSLLFGEPEGSEIMKAGNSFLDLTKDSFRTFKHGALHGTVMGIFVVLPLFATNAMFERKSWKLTWVNVGYWTISLAIMGGIICVWQ